VIETLSRRYSRDRWILITLTVRRIVGSLPELASVFKASFKELRRRRLWRDSIRGAIAGYEVTFDAHKGWHFHVHILALRKRWLEQRDLSNAWFEVTAGAGYIVDIRAVRDLRGGLREVIKYVFKPAELRGWGAEQVREFLALRKARLAESFGCFRAVELDLSGFDDQSTEDGAQPLFDGAPCPLCGGELRVLIVPAWMIPSRRGGIDSS
jgi:hypothetical protein